MKPDDAALWDISDESGDEKPQKSQQDLYR
jgi:hypothetical protein